MSEAEFVARAHCGVYVIFLPPAADLVLPVILKGAGADGIHNYILQLKQHLLQSCQTTCHFCSLATCPPQAGESFALKQKGKHFIPCAVSIHNTEFECIK